MCNQDSASWVELWRDMVGEDLLNDFLGRLMTMGDFLERFIGWCKDSVVCSGAVQDLHEVWVLVDELCEFGRVLAASDELVDSLIRLVVTMSMARSVMFGWPMVGRLMMRMIEDIDILHCPLGRIKPSLSIKLGHRGIALESRLCLLSCLGSGIDGIVDCILTECNTVFEGLFDAGPDIFDVACNSVEEGLGGILGFDDDLVGELFIGDDECC